MGLTTSLTELTTSATDLVLALECAVVIAYLRRISTDARWRVGIWSWVFGLVAFAALLGTIAHGIQMRPSLQSLLWHPLNLSLGLVVALFVDGALGDWRGRTLALRLLPWCVGLGVVFLGIAVLLDNAFIVFVVYEGTAMAGVLALYSYLALTRRLAGAAVMVAAIILNLAAVAVQASSLSLSIFVPFDNNGLFHLIQMVAMAVLALGVSTGMPRHTAGTTGEPSSPTEA